jgi:hypothetical protein
VKDADATQIKHGRSRIYLYPNGEIVVVQSNNLSKPPMNVTTDCDGERTSFTIPAHYPDKIDPENPDTWRYYCPAHPEATVADAVQDGAEMTCGHAVTVRRLYTPEPEND